MSGEFRSIREFDEERGHPFGCLITTLEILIIVSLIGWLIKHC